MAHTRGAARSATAPRARATPGVGHWPPPALRYSVAKRIYDRSVSRETLAPSRFAVLRSLRDLRVSRETLAPSALRYSVAKRICALAEIGRCGAYGRWRQQTMEQNTTNILTAVALCAVATFLCNLAAIAAWHTIFAH